MDIYNPKQKCISTHFCIMFLKTTRKTQKSSVNKIRGKNNNMHFKHIFLTRKAPCSISRQPFQKNIQMRGNLSPSYKDIGISIYTVR